MDTFMHTLIVNQQRTQQAAEILKDFKVNKKLRKKQHYKDLKHKMFIIETIVTADLGEETTGILESAIKIGAIKNLLAEE